MAELRSFLMAELKRVKILDIRVKKIKNMERFKKLSELRTC
jgi:hypothetical protein